MQTFKLVVLYIYLYDFFPFLFVKPPVYLVFPKDLIKIRIWKKQH